MPQAHVLDAVLVRNAAVRFIVAPCKGVVLGLAARTAPTRRDVHIRLIKQHWRMNWQKTSGYNQRSNVEAAIGRYKRLIGDALCSREDARRVCEVTIAVEALNRMLELGHPICVRVAGYSLHGAILTREHPMQQSREQEPLTSVWPGGRPAGGRRWKPTWATGLSGMGWN
jgi:hypothetical protein